MLDPIIIHTLDAPELEPYRTLRRPLDHQRRGIFVAEATKVVERLLRSPLEVLSCLLTPEWLTEFTPLLEARSPRPSLYVAEKPVLEKIVGFHLHQGAMAVARIPKPVALEELAAPLADPLLLVALDGMANAENVGVLVRNCAAFGVDGLIVGETSSSPYLRRAVRNSMGTVFAMSIVHVDDLAASLQRLEKQFAVRAIAAHPAGTHAASASLRAPRKCLVFGSEGLGVSPPVLKACSLHVSIPMAPGVDSLNVASASAVLLYEAVRSRP